jgi:hypothetical protein
MNTKKTRNAIIIIIIIIAVVPPARGRRSNERKALMARPRKRWVASPLGLEGSR